MPIAPPTTQDIWSSVSERAKADVRTSSGTSRWIIASSDSFDSAWVNPATAASAATITVLKKIAASTATPRASPSTVATISSGPRALSHEPTAVPKALPASGGHADDA